MACCPNSDFSKLVSVFTFQIDVVVNIIIIIIYNKHTQYDLLYEFRLLLLTILLLHL